MPLNIKDVFIYLKFGIVSSVYVTPGIAFYDANRNMDSGFLFELKWFFELMKSVSLSLLIATPKVFSKEKTQLSNTLRCQYFEISENLLD